MKGTISALVITLAGSLSSFAVSPEQPKEKITPILGIPSTGEKLTFRFVVQNDGDMPTHVYDPFYNETRLVVIFPDGKKKEICTWKEMSSAPGPNLQPGKTVQWDVDISQWLQMKDPGWYRVSFRVNGIESNQVIIIKD
jgi:hypothetical protein